MRDIVRKTVIERFQEGVDSAIKNIIKNNSYEWDNNPFYATAMTLEAINEAKNVYKQMLKDNSGEFEIDKGDVDEFIENVGTLTHKKYFY